MDKRPSSRTLQLETRPHSPSNGHILNQIAGTLPLHVSSICSYPLLPGETEGRIGCPSFAESGVVPTAPQKPH